MIDDKLVPQDTIKAGELEMAILDALGRGSNTRVTS
jgi:hypothetical protein